MQCGPGEIRNAFLLMNNSKAAHRSFVFITLIYTPFPLTFYLLTFYRFGSQIALIS